MQSLDVGRPGPAESHFGVDADNEADIKVNSWRLLFCYNWLQHHMPITGVEL